MNGDTAPAIPCDCGHDRRDHDEWGWGQCLACGCQRFVDAPKRERTISNFIPLTAQERVASRLREDATGTAQRQVREQEEQRFSVETTLETTGADASKESGK